MAVKPQNKQIKGLATPGQALVFVGVMGIEFEFLVACLIDFN